MMVLVEKNGHCEKTVLSSKLVLKQIFAAVTEGRSDTELQFSKEKKMMLMRKVLEMIKKHRGLEFAHVEGSDGQIVTVFL